jgi:Uma2 family endonuclease
MATRTSKARTRDLGRVPYRFTAEEVLELAEFLRHDAELWDGVLYRLVKNEPHNFTVGQVADALRQVLPRASYTIREEKSCALGDHSLPEPDVAVARGPRRAYTNVLPELAALPLVIEVCHSTESADYGLKLRRYAEIGIPCYWVVNVARRRVDVFHGPQGSGESAGYTRRESYAEGNAVPFALDDHAANIPVSDLLPGRDVGEDAGS